MNLYIHRIHFIISAADRPVANAIAADMDPDTGGALTFGEPSLSADGSEPATHILSSTAATAAMVTEMGPVLAGGMVPSIQFWTLDAATETLHNSNVSEATGQPWTVADTLTAAGLVRVVVEMEFTI